ncbi:MAG: dihydroorotase [Burkholderiales bacterium]|nr:dihydroorotase [Burkholderiales bacterium]
MKLLIRNGTAIDPHAGSERRADIAVAQGRIVAVGQAPEGFRADHTLDATGLHVCPGLVDLCARVAGSAGEARAAAAGGVTSAVCPPDTDPPLDEPGLVERLIVSARGFDGPQLHPLGALTQGLAGERLSEMAELRAAGCVGFGQGDAPLRDHRVLQRALQYAATFDLGVWLRPQDRALAAGGVAHDGEVASRLGLPGIPVSAETVAIASILILARETGARVHLCRLSSAEGVALVRAARRDGLAISCDVAAAHVHLTEMDIGYFDARCNLVPPLRAQRDRDALRAGLADGTIDAICSDHIALAADAKEMPFGEAVPGASAVELLLSLVVKWAREAALTLPAALAAVTARPAAAARLAAGSLQPGAPADLCVFDADAWWRVDDAALQSGGKSTPFQGVELPARVRHTLVGGRLVHSAR